MKSDHLVDLMKSNVEKMNYQQSMCFQMKYWTIAITVGILGIVWKTDWTFSPKDRVLLVIFILFHILLILFLFYIRTTTRHWMTDFIVFRERTKLLEKEIVELNTNNEHIDLSDYYKYHWKQSSVNGIHFESIRKTFRNELKDRFFIYLIGITFTSLFAMICLIMNANVAK